jgi:hypothetical protein
VLAGVSDESGRERPVRLSLSGLDLGAILPTFFFYAPVCRSQKRSKTPGLTASLRASASLSAYSCWREDQRSTPNLHILSLRHFLIFLILLADFESIIFFFQIYIALEVTKCTYVTQIHQHVELMVVV